MAEAMDVFDRYDREGLIHTVWTIRTPYVIAICNCSLDSCMGFRFQQQGCKTLFRAEYVAVVDPDRCAGCKACLEKCPFGAIFESGEDGKVIIDPRKCYGCGLCRRNCQQDAIVLVERKEHAIARDIW